MTAQDDEEWMAMAIQDPVEESISGDSRVGTVKTVVEPELDVDEEELLRATGGTSSDIPTGDTSDLQWTKGVPLIKIEDENVTRPSPAVSLTPIQPPVETEMLSLPESPGSKKLCL